MTIEEAKRELPSVSVKMPNGKIYPGRVTGRCNPHPTVTIQYDYKIHSKSPKPWIDFQCSWAQVARKATDGTPIIYC